MTEEELTKLIEVTASRPLVDAMTIRRGKRKGQLLARVKDSDRVKLEALGRERALIYKTLVLTGLRKNELATLTVAQLHLDGDIPHLELDAADEKSREGNRINVRDDLAGDIRSWLDYKLSVLQSEATKAGRPVPNRLPGGDLVFVVPYELVKILDRDLKAAGIPKRDERGWTLDVHALRTTFGTMLGGHVSPRTAQTALRHSDPKLTARYYTDPKLLEVRPSLDVLPALSLGRENRQARPAGFDGRLALLLAVQADRVGYSVAEPVTEALEDNPRD
jgi:integrase